MTASPPDAGTGMPSEEMRKHIAMVCMGIGEDRDPENVAEMFRVYEGAEHWTLTKCPAGCGRCDVDRAYAHADRILALIRPALEAKEREALSRLTRAMRQAQDWRAAAEAAESKIEAISNVKHYLAVSEVEDPFVEMIDECEAMEARALSAEAKLREANMQALSDEGQMRELQAKLAQAVEALRPFAWPPLYVFDKDQAFVPTTMPEDWEGGGYFTTEDFRRARSAAALASGKERP
jgi:DnaJ-domain-containing protein 1